MNRYKILLDLLNKLRPMDLPHKDKLYDNLIDIENHINNSGQIKPLVIRQAGIDEYCSICKDREIYKPENLPIVKIVGSRNCHYCGNEINFCKQHWELFKRQFESLSV